MTQPADRRYFQRPDGLVDIDTPVGRLPIAASLTDLDQAGFRPGVQDIAGMMADSDAEADAREQDKTRGALLARLAPADQASAAISHQPRPPAPVASSPGGPSSMAAELRGGGTRKNVDVPSFGSGGGSTGGASARFVKGGDQRVGFQIERTNLRREDVEAAEEAEADASIERKLAAQNIADRQGSRVEQVSAELGRQIRAEGQAIREQEKRNEAMRGEYQTRLASLEQGRQRVADLAEAPVKRWQDDNTFAGIIGKIAVLAAGLSGNAFGGRNLAIEQLDKQVEDSVKAKREKWEMARAHLKDEQDEFGQLVALYGSPQAAEEELRDRQRMYIQAYGQKMALDAGAVDAADHLRAQFADWDDQRAQSRLAREQALAGTIQESFAYQPDRMIGGAPKVDEREVQALGAARSKEGLGGEESAAGNIRDLISEIPEGDVIETFESKNALSRLGRTATDAAFGRGTSAQWYDSENERAAAAKLGRVKSAIISRLSGANVPPQEYERLAEGINETNTREGLERYANEVERAIGRKDAAVKAGFRPEVVQTYEERQRGYRPPERARGQRSER